MQYIDVSIRDDNVVEGEEVFIVVLSESEENVMLGNDQRNITIRDNDGRKLKVVPIVIYLYNDGAPFSCDSVPT